MRTQSEISNDNGLAVAFALRAVVAMLSFFCLADCQAQQLVVIHYANNTAPAGKNAENHNITIERLEQIANPKAKSIADNLRNEPQLLATALHADRTILRDELVLCQS